MNWKRVSVIATVTLFIIILSFVIYGFLSNKTKLNQEKQNNEAAIQVSRDFSLAWYNYNRQSDSSYMAKLKPFMTNGFYDATNYINTSRPQDFVDQPKLTSTIKDIQINSISQTDAQTTVGLESTEGSSKIKQVNESVLTLTKVGNVWLVQDLEPVVKQ
jgi:hypothetical protein